MQLITSLHPLIKVDHLMSSKRQLIQPHERSNQSLAGFGLERE